jgi:hypothetical protein
MDPSSGAQNNPFQSLLRQLGLLRDEHSDGMPRQACYPSFEFDPRFHREEIGRSSIKSWTYEDFKGVLLGWAAFNAAPERYPLAIALGSKRLGMDRITALSADGNEHGRFLFADCNTKELKAGPISHGTKTQVVVATLQPRSLTLVGMEHSHPSDFHAPLHLSPKDFSVFLKSERLLFTAVTTADATLIAFKTQETLGVLKLKSVADTINECISSAIRQRQVSGKQLNSELTFCICRAFKLDLFVQSPRIGELARRIKI